MKDAELKVIRFGESDVIATSALCTSSYVYHAKVNSYNADTGYYNVTCYQYDSASNNFSEVAISETGWAFEDGTADTETTGGVYASWLSTGSDAIEVGKMYGWDSSDFNTYHTHQ